MLVWTSAAFLFVCLMPPASIHVAAGTPPIDDQESKTSDNLGSWDRLPVIGVLTQKTNYPTSAELGTTFILAQYVKWLQAGGANVVPIRPNQPDSYYEDITSKINGVLFPGGGRNLRISGYAKAAKKINQLALEYNDAGSYFPLWGTCLGFQLMNALRTEGMDDAPGFKYASLTRCDAKEYMIPLNFTKDFRSSRLFKSMDPSLVKIISEKNITANQHKFCVPPWIHNTTEELSSFFSILSTNTDRKGFEFISTMEAKDYPFYGVQWHAERGIFGMGARHTELFTSESVRVGQYFTNFFVNEARKSDHRFTSTAEEASVLIDNHHPVRIPFKHYLRYIFPEN
ncbi:gamma-glutamyl hydrolase-like [Lineus longissimus]|uniref:gamma-glutamyl hydrolase-like n=1 Tax=Lineus longissimus TaxID=88925 RepID=UPI002B4CCBD4